MKLFCTIDNLGYGEVTDITYNGENDLFIGLKFNNGRTKTLSFNFAVGKTLFVDDKLNEDDGTIIWNMICDELGSKRIDEIKEKVREFSKNKMSNKIYEMLKTEHNFEGFMHETTIGNLASILKDGKVKPRNELRFFEDSANNEVINHTSSKVKNSVRFYFFKKTPTNYNFDKKNPDNMAYIVFKWDLVDIPGAMFVNGNASCENSESISVKDYFNNPGDFMDWDSISDRGYLPTYEDCIVYGCFDQKNEMIRKRNAEINIPTSVKTDYIEKIVFKTVEEYHRFVKKLNNDIILEKYIDKMVINSSYFN